MKVSVKDAFTVVMVLLVIGITVYYYTGPRVLVYSGDAPHHVCFQGLLIKKLALEHDGYRVIKANSPSELKSKVLMIHVDEIYYEKNKNSKWVMFIDKTSKTAVYYKGTVCFKGNEVYVVKPLFWIIR